MNFIKRVFFTICILIMMMCAGVLVCAMNPEITERIVAFFDGSGKDNSAKAASSNQNNQNPNPSNTENNQTGGNAGVNGNSQIPSDSNALSNAVVSPYQIPDSKDISTPGAVNGKSGYQPVKDTEQKVADSDAKTLEKQLDKGNLGTDETLDSTFYPYYAMLSSDMQTLYRQILANAKSVTISFAPVVDVDVNQLKTVFEALFADHPELFWVDTSYTCKYTQNGKVVEIDLNFYPLVNNLAAEKEKFEGQANNIINGAQSLTSEYEKEKYVHDALVSKVTYDASASMSQSAYSALVNGRSVCAGYSRAFQYIMQSLGIPTYYCMGYSGEDHAWNIVKLSDGYYNVDVTWDDTNPSTYDYFNKSDADYASTHMRTGLSVYLPACTGTAYSDREKGATQTISLPIEPAPSENTGKTQPLIWLRPETDNSTGNDKKNTENTQNNQTVSGNDYVVPDSPALQKAGVKPKDVITNITAYYENCYHQLVSMGYGDRQFVNVVTDVELIVIEQDYSNGRYMNGYVDAALKKLGMDYFAIDIQVEYLGDGFYRLYHNVVTWTDQ